MNNEKLLISPHHLIDPKKIRISLARKNLLDFTLYNYDDYQVNWHHRILCQTCQDFITDPDFNRLMVFMPPQHGKSEIVSKQMVAFALGLNPKLRIANCCYNATHAKKFNRETQRIIESDQYYDVFPNTQLTRSSFDERRSGYVQRSDLFEIVGHGGGYQTVGVEGGLTGNRVDIGIIDDPLKDYEEARSEVRREMVWNWYNSALESRLHNQSKVCIVMTRWHEDDLAGRLIDIDPENKEGWRFLILRAIKEEDDDFEYDIRDTGEALWPVRFSSDNLLKRKAKSEKNFQSLYQQKPNNDEGNIFKRKDFREYRHMPDIESFGRSCVSVDAAFKDSDSSDNVAIQVWARRGIDIFLIFSLAKQMSFVQTVGEIIKVCNAFPWVRGKVIEAKANGSAIMSVLEKRIIGMTDYSPSTSKKDRAHAVSPLFEAGNIWIPHQSIAPWANEFIEELVGFPHKKRDDQVDACTQALLYLTDKEELKPVNFD